MKICIRGEYHGAKERRGTGEGLQSRRPAIIALVLLSGILVSSCGRGQGRSSFWTAYEAQCKGDFDTFTRYNLYIQFLSSAGSTQAARNVFESGRYMRGCKEGASVSDVMPPNHLRVTGLSYVRTIPNYRVDMLGGFTTVAEEYNSSVVTDYAKQTVPVQMILVTSEMKAQFPWLVSEVGDWIQDLPSGGKTSEVN